MRSFENCIVYKIYCKDPNVTEFYIGSTIDLIKRLYTHKCHCKSRSSKKLYNYINENGGWENFNCDIIENVSCTSSSVKHDRERHYIESLKPTLNINLPYKIDFNKKEYRRSYMKEYFHSEKGLKFKEYHRKYMKFYMRKIYEKKKIEKEKLRAEFFKEQIELLKKGIIFFD